MPMVDVPLGGTSTMKMDPRDSLWPQDWLGAKRLLCVRLDTLGDVAMMEPAIRALRQATPGRSVTLLTSSSGAAAARLMQSADEILIYNSPWMKHSPSHRDAAADRGVVETLRQRQFDGAVIFNCFSQSPLPAAMLCYWADIPLRLAYCRENPYQLLTHWARELEPEQGIRHEVRRQLDLVARVGAEVADRRMRLAIREEDVAFAVARLSSAGVEVGRPWIVVHPGASAESRRWPAEYFASAVDEIARLGIQIVFTGQRPEQSLVEQIRDQMMEVSASLVGQLDVGQLLALLSRATLLLSNNTGPVHLAAGVGTPVVDVYALTNPQHTPWHVASRVVSRDVPCKYCFRSVCPEGHHACMRGIEPAEVVEAVRRLLEERGRIDRATTAHPAGLEHVDSSLMTAGDSKHGRFLRVAVPLSR